MQCSSALEIVSLRPRRILTPVRTERCLAYDEKPLLLFQKLKESGQRPVFMLRHIVSHA
jgi:hypothetical protein